MKKTRVKNYVFSGARVFIAAAVIFVSGCSKPWENIDLPGENARVIESEAAVPAERKSAAPAAKSDVIEIKDRLFISQVNDVYINTDDYLGKTIKVEGIFKEELYEGKEEPYRFVIRYGPGCCGYDGNVGFEIVWGNDKNMTYPEFDSWVEAAGVVKTYEENEGFQYVYLDLVSLKTLETRGLEIVNQ